MITLTAASHNLFVAYAKDSGNWAGTPLVGGNVPSNPETNGNLTDLKQKGLIETFDDGADVFIDFTNEGKQYAAAHGIIIEPKL